MLDLNALASLDRLSKHDDVFDGRVKRLVSSTLLVINIFANGSPIFQLEDLFSENLIGVGQAIENEAARTY